MGIQHLQIGEVGQRTGLSLRTIRYYEEVGLVVPSARTQGGFRLYTETDVARLNLIKRMKPLDFSLEEMRELLRVLDELESTGSGSARAELTNQLVMFRETAEERCRALREQLDIAEDFATSLRHEIVQQRRLVESKEPET